MRCVIYHSQPPCSHLRKAVGWEDATQKHERRNDTSKRPRADVRTILRFVQQRVTHFCAQSDEDGIADSDTDQDDSIEIIVPARGKIGLKDQHLRVRRVATIANQNIMADVLLVDAFPDGLGKTTDFARYALIKAAEEKEYGKMVRRLKTDKTYWTKLGSIVSTSERSYHSVMPADVLQ